MMLVIISDIFLAELPKIIHGIGMERASESDLLNQIQMYQILLNNIQIQKIVLLGRIFILTELLPVGLTSIFHHLKDNMTAGCLLIW